MADTEALVQAKVDIATHRVEIIGLQKSIADMKTSITELTRTVEAMRDQITEAKGSWKALMFLGGAGATFGGGVVLAVQNMFKIPLH